MNSSFWYSLIGHILVMGLFFVSLPTFEKKQTITESVPIFIDLKNIEIADKTNLPPKAKAAVQKEVKPKSVPQKEISKPKVQPKQEEVKPVQKAEPIKDAAKIVEPKPKEIKVPQKPKTKPAPPKKAQKVSVKSKPKAKQEDGLDSLLASVEKMEKTTPKQISKESDNDVSDLIAGVLNGIPEGKTKSLGNKITISQTDFIASTVHQHWNFDAGVEGVYDMIIEIQVSLNRNGDVSAVEFLNKSRYDSDAAFRSVADSARRAVLICDKLGQQSPFRILASKYPQNYSDWQKIQLRFNPMNGGVS